METKKTMTITLPDGKDFSVGEDDIFVSFLLHEKPRISYVNQKPYSESYDFDGHFEKFLGHCTRNLSQNFFLRQMNPDQDFVKDTLVFFNHRKESIAMDHLYFPYSQWDTYRFYKDICLEKGEDPHDENDFFRQCISDIRMFVNGMPVDVQTSYRIERYDTPTKEYKDVIILWWNSQESLVSIPGDGYAEFSFCVQKQFFAINEMDINVVPKIFLQDKEKRFYSF